LLPLMVLSEWLFKLGAVVQSNFQVNIAMVGKYTGLSDSYLSVLKVTFYY
jgi:CTP synthase (UTP-ammonia lyase)